MIIVEWLKNTLALYHNWIHNCFYSVVYVIFKKISNCVISFENVIS